jgi:hypothetical protein
MHRQISKRRDVHRHRHRHRFSHKEAGVAGVGVEVQEEVTLRPEGLKHPRWKLLIMTARLLRLEEVEAGGRGVEDQGSVLAWLLEDASLAVN